jgi:RHS repeat-associated protein
VLAAAARGGTADSPITWVFEPESFAPLAKVVGDSRYAIVTDHLGTPKAMFDATGAEVWSASIDAYGNLRDIKGDHQSCPFRWPGQYEDQETGLYYNRFRYYDPDAGQYASQDPIRLIGGLRAHAYPNDPACQLDPLGLSCVSKEEKDRREDAFRFYREAGFPASRAWDHMRGIDFSHPVERELLPKGKTLAQHKMGDGLGNYFAEPGTLPTNLGISPAGRIETTLTSTRAATALKSTAASVLDTWTVKGSPYVTNGGATQFFVPDKGAFVP